MHSVTRGKNPPNPIRADLTSWVGRDAHPHYSMVAAGVPAGHFRCQDLRGPKSYQSPPFLKWDLGGFSWG